MKITSADKKHLPGIVECHVAAFPKEFTTLMGRRFLRAFYGYYINQPGGICLVAIDEGSGRVMGLVKGGAPELRSKFTHKYVPRFVGVIIFRILTHSYFRRRLLHHIGQAFLKVGRKLGIATKQSQGNPPPPEDPQGTWSSLLSICAHPDFRGRGAGAALMEAFRAESQKRGYKTMRLSVHNANEAAIALYKRCGWQAIQISPNGTYFKRSVEENA